MFTQQHCNHFETISHLPLCTGLNEARLRLLNPVASGTWMTATLREAPRLVAQKRRLATRSALIA